MKSNPKTVINLQKYALDETNFRVRCRQALTERGALVLPDFLHPDALRRIRTEGLEQEHRAFYSSQKHNVYLEPADRDYEADHPRNRLVESTKGCITDDIVATDSPLRLLYQSPAFKEFLCFVLREGALYPYADPLSSINLHYAKTGQELGWHFDNSSFATTLLIQEPEAGGVFEYVSDLRDADADEMYFEDTAAVLDGDIKPRTLSMHEGALVLFRGRNAIHRVTPVQGPRTRMLAVLAYNAEPGISLSKSARMTFYGRLE